MLAGTGDLPPAVRAFIETTNSGDTEGFVASFTEDAYLNDWGREFRGHDSVGNMNFQLRNGLIQSLVIS